jgi:hypothetical protein
MKYELHYEINGRIGECWIEAGSWSGAIEKFAEWWEETGGEMPAPKPW